MLSQGFRRGTGLIRAFGKILTDADVSINVKQAEYSIRGPVETRAQEILRDTALGKTFSFGKLIPCHIGNPYAVGKPVMTFPRQVVSIAEYPKLAKLNPYPQEVVDRALEFLDNSPAIMGAYSSLQGHPSVRQDIARFVEQRDGFPADPELIYCSEGATCAIREVFAVLLHGKQDGLLMPQPRYPLYSALTAFCDCTMIPYELDEERGWAFNQEAMLKAIKKARQDGLKLKAVVVINPGNPTGTVLRTGEMRQIIEICEDEGIVLLADEVYQDNVYGGLKWSSFRHEALKMHSKVQLMSFHSISKGFMGECGHRGGYVELVNIHDGIRAQLHKLFSMMLCPNSVGQLMMDIAVRPPTGPVCGKQWIEERSRELRSLEDRATILQKALSSLPGIRSQKATGSMYLFPSIDLPAKFIKEVSNATFKGQPIAPDLVWALGLLDQEGVVVSPGSGFGQKPGTHHFRISFLPQAEAMQEVIDRVTRYQTKFMDRYG
jgi:aspartate/methionine/tyrosine aminotransferase